MADDPIRVEHNQELKPLKVLLPGVERAGDFFVIGTVEIPMPKLEVEGVGVLSLPVPPSPNRRADRAGGARALPQGHCRARGTGGIGGESLRRKSGRDEAHRRRPRACGGMVSRLIFPSALL